MLRILVLLFALAGPPAHATTVLAVDVQDQALESDALIEAVVGTSHTFAGDRMVTTDTELSVVRVIGGEAPTKLTIRQAGGTLDGRTTFLPGDARLEPGQRIAAFVRKIDGQWYFTALAQSVWHVEGEGPKAAVHRDVDGSHFMERNGDGAIVPAIQSPLEYATLNELLEASKGLTFGGAL